MLTVDDVVAFTDERLGDTDETQRMLSAALAAARGWCGWHVTPLLTDDEITVDGPGGRLLVLPTGQLIDISKITEEGVEVDLTTLTFSVSGLVRKPIFDTWTAAYGGITATIDHGYDSAPDFDQAVLETVDRMASAVGKNAGASGTLVMRRVQEVTYQWAPIAGTLLNAELLASYRLPILA